MRRTALERVGALPFTPLSESGEDYSFFARDHGVPLSALLESGEDYSFYVRAHGVGLASFVDTGAIIAHIGDNGDAFVPGAPAGRIVGGQLHLPKRFEVPTGARKSEELEAGRVYGLRALDFVPH